MPGLIAEVNSDSRPACSLTSVFQADGLAVRGIEGHNHERPLLFFRGVKKAVMAVPLSRLQLPSYSSIRFRISCASYVRYYTTGL